MVALKLNKYVQGNQELQPRAAEEMAREGLLTAPIETAERPLPGSRPVPVTPGTIQILRRGREAEEETHEPQEGGLRRREEHRDRKGEPHTLRKNVQNTQHHKENWTHPKIQWTQSKG
ncbi:hypothetical protein FGO68_gene15264 [Halteria grandinella]|uniref:Uncharacterized protein n=1 Tax=Halteria grandinella TaxID=5974 RepID=A0A8J8T9R1_HALGN|nr:hypothetical protein FGO68_gene15264 [Halteria grandinella]